jgi:hypothetical protein
MKSIIQLACTLLLVLLTIFACTTKKLSSNYGDNKTYADEDSTSADVRIKEKQAKMPFDTSSVVPKIEKVQPKLYTE